LASAKEHSTVQSPDFTVPSVRRARGSAREVESLLWLAAGAAWAIVALKAWAQSKRAEARRRTFSVSDKLLGEVFPNGIKP
jgi:hypothetical protein